MSHDYHPRLNALNDTEGPSPIYFDGCAECERKARDILLWNKESAAALWAKMVVVEYDGAGSYRSEAESAACGLVYAVSIYLERHAQMDPHLVLARHLIWAV